MNVENKIISIIGNAMPMPMPITKNSNLYTDLGFDSLGFVRLLTEIEEAFFVSICLMEMEQCLQVGILIDIIESKL